MKPLFKPSPTEFFAGVARLPSPWAHAAHKPVFIAFLVCFAIAWTALLLGGSPSEDWPWLNGLFWLLAAATSLTGLARRLPEQNVFVAATLIVAVSFGIAIIAEKTGVPFGPRTYTAALGEKILGVPGPIPLFWLAVTVNGRGVSRLIIRPWRKQTYYGFCDSGLTWLPHVGVVCGLRDFL